jgi:hypothetical protein
MGIRGLAGFLRWRLPQIRQNVQWTGHAGKRWGIDCSCLLFRARGAGLSQLTVIASLIVRMRSSGIVPVVVFDGRPPAAKASVIEQRREVREEVKRELATIQGELTVRGATMTEFERAMLEKKAADLQKKAPQVTRDDKDALKQFLYAAGVQFVTAVGEADDVLAYLCRTGYLGAVVSTDMDMFARGVPLLVMPETADGAVLTQVTTADVLAGLGLTYDQFVDACMLMGSDYSGKDWVSVEPRVAVERVRAGVNWAALDASGALLAGARMLRGDGLVWEEIVAERQREKWAVGLASPKAREFDNLATICVNQGWPVEWLRILTFI